MLSNRITRYFDAEESITKTMRPTKRTQKPMPPANFAPIPAALFGNLSKEQLASVEQLYRAAYEAAKAQAVAVRARNN